MMNKHVLVVSTSYPDIAYQDGQEAAGSFVADFVQALSQHVRVTAVVPTIHPALIIDNHENLTVYRFPVPRLPLSLLAPTNPAHWRAIIQTIKLGRQAVQKVSEQIKPEHIFALWALPSGYWAKKTGYPYSIWALGSDIWSLGKIPFVRRELQSVLQSAGHCYADGFKLAENVQELSGRKCHFLASSRVVKLSQPKQLSTAPPYRLAFLGRWHLNKGVDLLLESLHLLSDEDWERISEVRLFGGGPLAELVYSQVEGLRTKGRPIVLGGYLDRFEARALYEWADYVLLPSRVESIPVVFSDAMQTECPLITMPIGDIPLLMKEGSVGFLASAVDSQAFAQVIRTALYDSPKKFDSAMSLMKRRFDLVETVKKIIKTF